MLPKHVVEKLRKIRANETLEDPSLDSTYRDLEANYSEEKSFILESFFKMMMKLKSLKREFAIVFHSHDPNIEKLQAEFNQ